MFTNTTALCGGIPPSKLFVSLALRVTQFLTLEIADIAMDRIIHALNRGEACISLENLERQVDSS